MQAPDYAPASVRNAAPILGVLREELDNARHVLEIGSGTGYHAVTFAAAMPQLTWQTSDLDDNHARILAAIEQSGAANVLPPLSLDVRTSGPPASRYDAVYTSNTAHIMSEAAVESMFALLGSCLSDAGRFVCYGPFKRGGRFNTPSNAAFDASLSSRDPSMAIRDLDDCDRFAVAAGLARRRVYAMPTNNLLVIWQREIHE